MYEISTNYLKRNKQVGYIILVLSILSPIVFIGLSFLMFYPMNNFDASTQSIESDVISYYDDGFTMYTPGYTYQVGDQLYQCRGDYASSDKSEIAIPSKQVTVYYRTDKPDACTIQKPSYAFLIIPILGGSLFFIILLCRGLPLLLDTYKTTKKLEYLQQHGKLIKDLSYGIKSNQGRYSMNLTAIKRLVVEYTSPIDQKVMTLVGNRRADHITKDSDGKVDLLIDETNPKIFYIDFHIEPKR